MNKSKALIVIDVQKGFDSPRWGVPNNPDAEKHIAVLLSFWRKHGMPIVHVRHNSTDPNSPLAPGQQGNEFKDLCAPLDTEKIFTKVVNSAFIGTELKNYLNQQLLSRLVVVGFTTDHCVSTTVRMAGNYGYQVELVEDATKTFGKFGINGRFIPASTVHEVSLASLKDEFCEVVKTKDIVCFA